MCDILKNSCISQDNIFLPLINLLAQGKVSSTDLTQDKVTYLNKRALSVRQVLSSKAKLLIF